MLYYLHDKIYYNNNSEEKIPKYIEWGTLIYCNNLEEIPKITKGIMTYEERNILMDNLKKLKNDKAMMTELEALKWDDWERNTIYNDGKNIGLQEGESIGLEKGIKLGLKETIQNMLKNNFSIDDIMKLTNQPIEYINQIKEE